jgi:hypothetical protein
MTEYKFHDKSWYIKERYRSIAVASKYSCEWYVSFIVLKLVYNSIKYIYLIAML